MSDLVSAFKLLTTASVTHILFDMVLAVDAVLLFLAGLVVAYLLLVTLAAAFAAAPDRTSAGRRRFAVVVPAHNEESGIAETVASCLACEYPRERFDVCVVADNCTDSTAAAARAAGAVVYERHDPSARGKGHALRWVFGILEGKGYDAIIIVDADSRVTPNFIAAMDVRLDGGSRVLQATDIVDPQRGSWSVEMTRIGFLLYNVARPLGRAVLGGSMGLRGNGMCFEAGVLRDHPWKAFSLTEDVEYGIQLTLAGVPVTFVPEATVFAVMPQRSSNALSQRARWEGGRFPIIRAYQGRLLKAALRGRSWRLLDAWVDLVIPPVVNLTGVFTLLAVVHLAAAWMGLDLPAWAAFGWAGLAAGMVLHVLGGLAVAGAGWQTYLTLLQLPVYVLWKIRLYAGHIVTRRKDDWVRTTREQPPHT